MGHRLLVDRFVRLDHKDPEDPTSRVVKRTRYSKGDVIEGLSDDEVERLTHAGAIVEESDDDPDLAPVESLDPTNSGSEFRGLAGDGPVTDLGNDGDGEDTDEESEGQDGGTGEADGTAEREFPDYGSWDYDRIKDEAAKRGVTGPDGSLKKKDLLVAIEAHDESNPIPA